MSLHPILDELTGVQGLRLLRAAENVAGAETDEPNFEPFLAELQEAVKPFAKLISPPRVGQTVWYFNPAYAPSDNGGTGVGPYAAFVTRAWDYYDSLMCNLAVLTPGKETTFHAFSVPQQGSRADDGQYPCWHWIGEKSAARSKPVACAHCAEPAITELDGDNLCQAHADAWCRGERSDTGEDDPHPIASPSESPSS